MRIFLLVFSTLVSPFSSGKLFAQDQHTTDSLLKVLTEAQDDTNKVNILNALSKQFWRAGNYDEGKNYSDKALSLAGSLRFGKQQGWVKGIANAYSNMGFIYRNQSNYPESLKSFSLSLKASEEGGYNKGIANAYNNIGIICVYQGNSAEALKNYWAALKIQNEIGNKQGSANAYNNIGLIYEDQGNYPEALKNYFLALKISEEVADKQGMAGPYNNIGNVYLRQDNYSEALKNYSAALKINEETGDKKKIATSYGNVGNAYLRMRNYTEALKYQFSSLKISEEIGNKQNMATANDNIGDIHSKQGDYDQALKNYFSALKIQEEIGEKRGAAISTINIGDVYTKQKLFNKALPFLKKGLSLAKEDENNDAVKGAYLFLAEASADMHDYKSAYEYHQLYSDIKDTLLNIENNKQIAQMQAQYAGEKKDNQIALLNKDKNIQEQKVTQQKFIRNVFIGGLILILLLTALLFNRYMIKIKANHLLEEKNTQIEAEKGRAETSQLRAEKSEKFKEQFLANMSHEIRTPMNAIVGMTNLVLNSKLDEQQHTYMDAIKKSSHNLLVIINDILDLSKIEAGKMEFEKINFKLQDVLNQVYSTLRFKAEEKSLKLNIETNEEVPSVIVGDPVRLNQILLNLAGNAIKFTEKGSVTIDVKNQTLGINNQETEDHIESICNLVFTVSDTGIGIPEERIDTIFESFNQADRDTFRKYGGTGLGLGISKYLIDLQGGSIAVKSKQGEGSSFTFLIPYQVGTIEGLQSETKTIDELQKSKLGNLRILLAEDNYFNQIVLVDTLQVLLPGITVEVAANGREAIEKLKSQHFDLVLMDVHMPEMNGLEAVHIIRETLPSPLNKIKIIALTASVTKAEITNCYEAGMDDYVPKPFEQEELVSKIAKLTLN
ncbi:MAG: tetratricopeptide repeat protein [Chitinophagales bacterium]